MSKPFLNSERKIDMRQSHKEAKLQSSMREGLLPERREAMVFGDDSRNEFAGELGAGSANAGHGRRHPAGGRG